MTPIINKKTFKILSYTLVFGGSFYLGILVYSLYSLGVNKEISIASIKEFGPQLNNVSQQDLRINADDKLLTVKSTELKKWLESYIRDYSHKEDLRVSYTQVTRYLQTIAPRFNNDPVNARFSFKEGRAEIFIPPSKGRSLNIPQSAAAITSSLFNNSLTATLSFEFTEPDVTLEKINDLGINTLLGKGESDYGKSSSARIHNIRTGMSKFNGIILKPGEQFSFNSILGEVDENSDYLAELVIKSGQLVKEFGGGLCQVATTVFRSAILAGLQIVERKPHSFPVQYYNPQGFDATIYPGVVDLRFINNTGAHILIQTRLIGSRLIVETYGSKEGKEVKIEGPIQYDKQPTGAMKAYFVRRIYGDDATLLSEERFNSVYKAPPPHPAERNPLE